MISVKKTPLKSFKDFVRREKPKDWNEIHTRKKNRTCTMIPRQCLSMSRVA